MNLLMKRSTRKSTNRESLVFMFNRSFPDRSSTIIQQARCEENGLAMRRRGSARPASMYSAVRKSRCAKTARHCQITITTIPIHVPTPTKNADMHSIPFRRPPAAMLQARAALALRAPRSPRRLTWQVQPLRSIARRATRKATANRPRALMYDLAGAGRQGVRRMYMFVVGARKRWQVISDDLPQARVVAVAPARRARDDQKQKAKITAKLYKIWQLCVRA